ncbi:phosphoglucosamine mutase [Salininema proteolyticum]|uniref:Phosphoglucosamine mutase n=1 Tax=Salininema proteolyticum TaxID=1607685 RepID=A0ABV8TSH0_9ACTN
MGRLFGTDGVRGRANVSLTPELALRLSEAAATVLRGDADTKPTVAVADDGRISGGMLKGAVSAGLASAGADVVDLGVIPTPATAFLVGELEADFGVMISASHNPMPDNGIKFFAAGGRKLPDAVEDAIESAMDAELGRPEGAGLGAVRTDLEARRKYVDHVVAACPHRLEGLTVVLDPANGAASEVAPEVLRACGATVHVVNGSPDGLNINENAGSTHIDGLRQAVKDFGADAGIALDGDADRCLAVNAAGDIVDGDAIMAVLALAMRERGELVDDTLVVTVMSNLGLHQAMQREGVRLETTKVGDRYVLERLNEAGLSLGGEQSGHVVIPSHATTGDGTLTAVMLLGRMAATGRSLEDLASVFRSAPQVLVNVPVKDKGVMDAEAVKTRLGEWTDHLGDAGRILLRPSGTEPLIRVMVEAATTEKAEEVAADLVASLEEAVRVQGS